MRPRMLDLFCGAGGCAVGYHRAGFDVVGVDNRPMPRYPFTFIQADAIRLLETLLCGAWSGDGKTAVLLSEIDVIHASPPCQAFSSGRFLPNTKTHVDLVKPVRHLLEATAKTWIIENVPGAPLQFPLILCGSMFGLKVRRHRLFETNRFIYPPGPCRHHEQQGDFPAGRSSNSKRRDKSKVVMCYGQGGSRGSVELWSKAMGIDWMVQREIGQAIPPAYTEFIGKQLIQRLP